MGQITSKSIVYQGQIGSITLIALRLPAVGESGLASRWAYRDAWKSDRSNDMKFHSYDDSSHLAYPTQANLWLYGPLDNINRDKVQVEK